VISNELTVPKTDAAIPKDLASKTHGLLSPAIAIGRFPAFTAPGNPLPCHKDCQFYHKFYAATK